MSDAPGQRLLSLWTRLSSRTGGKWLFSRIVGRYAPYTGTIGAVIEELRPGYARATLRDRHRVRNHLRSIHAVALVNLGEVVSGLAMLTALPPGIRGIVTGLSMEYTKKARGTLTADSQVLLPPMLASQTLQLVAEIRDEEGDVVARATVHWLVGPDRKASGAARSADTTAAHV